MIACIICFFVTAALVSFFNMGIALVGLPYIVRTILGLNAEYYGVAESALGHSAILGSIAAELLIEKLKIQKLYIVLAILGAFIVPARIVFSLPATTFMKYIVTLLALCGVQGTTCISSLFALSFIQQQMSNHLFGKVMAYISTITMCAYH